MAPGLSKNPAGFLDRPGAKKYIIGNLFKQKTMSNVIREFIKNKKEIEVTEPDRDFLDAWDHVAIKLANQQKLNTEFGIPLSESFLNIAYISEMLNINHNVHYSS